MYKSILIWLIICLPILGETVKYELTIAEKEISPTGKKRKALSINGGIPGPTLKFNLGDTAKITVFNKLKNEETSIHWHGLGMWLFKRR